MKRFYKTTVLVSLLGVGISNFSYGASRGAGAMRGTEGIGGTSFGGSDMIERRGVFDALPALGQRTVAINPRLRAAIERGDSNEVRRLHRDKANRNARTENGFTPLHLAARCGHVEIVRLLTRGANRNARDENGFTPLHWAAMNGHVDVVSALLGAEANIEVPDNAGHTPLH
ncbi:MAG: ankyrin repeat domain-containing protein, partial [Holosporales bacterium]|nr:ankyrin repeat domain-containing protein [Holosporales bacterium]